MPETQTQDLEIPDKVSLSPARYDWPIKRGGATDIPDARFPIFDPLKVQNIDVVDPGRREYIERLREDWILNGITITKQQRLKIDANGQPMLGESVMEPKPIYEHIPQTDEYGQPIFGPDGKAVMLRRTVYEVDEEGKVVMIEDLDAEGNPRRDELGNVIRVPKPVYQQAKDENGNLKFDKDGNPVWVMQPKYRNGRRVVKMLPLIVKRQVIIDGVPQTDRETGEPILVDEQVYEQEADRDGKPLFRNGEPVYVKVQEKDENGELIFDESGKPVMVPKKKMVPDRTPQTEVVEVIEAWFKDKARPYRELDRLTNTRFTIEKIFLSRVTENNDGDKRVRAGVDLLGDTGAKITLFLGE